jgi:uncharacterized membrane protein YfcA
MSSLGWLDLVYVFLSAFAGSFLGAYFGTKAFKADAKRDDRNP